MNASFDVIIVGAGVAGCAMAYSLGLDGKKPTLERDWKEPDRIVGELLQPGGVEALTKLGLRECIEGIDGIRVDGYVVFNGEEQVQLPYPVSEDGKKYTGKSFHHGKFIAKLREACKSVSNVTCLEGTCVELPKNSKDIVTGAIVSIKSTLGSSKQSFNAPLTIVCDGCFSKFRKEFTDKQSSVKSNFVGFVLQDCLLPAPNHGHVILANPSPILLYQIGTHDTRILVDIPGKLPSISDGSLKNHLKELVGPQLPKQVQECFYESLETERLRSMPNSWLPPTKNTRKGVIFVGDAMNMRHPLTGGGMTVALWDIVHIRDLIRQQDLQQVDQVSRAVSKLHWKRKSLSSVINILAQALYELFSAGDDPRLKQLQAACFGYFKLGGRCVSTPVGLLAGVIHSPITLVGHFFAVALYGIWMVCSQNPLYMLPMSLLQGLSVLYTACVVIVPVIVSELMPQ